MDGVGEADEKKLLQEFPKCHAVFAALKPASKDVIIDITKRMAGGMAEYVGKDLGQGTTDIKAYNRYCHFVAGLVGEGLSRLFAASGLEDKSLAGELVLSDQMGLFLQKTNIIRDYLEDYVVWDSTNGMPVPTLGGRNSLRNAAHATRTAATIPETRTSLDRSVGEP